MTELHAYDSVLIRSYVTSFVQVYGRQRVEWSEYMNEDESPVD